MSTGRSRLPPSHHRPVGSLSRTRRPPVPSARPDAARPHARPARADRIDRGPRLALARSRERPARRRSRHAPPLGGRGPRHRLHDPGRPPPLRPPGAGAPGHGTSSRHGPADHPAVGASAGRHGRDARATPAGVPAKLQRHGCAGRPGPDRGRRRRSRRVPERRPAAGRGARRAPGRRSRRRAGARGGRGRCRDPRRRPGPPACRRPRQPDRGGRAVRGGASPVPRRAVRARPAPNARSRAPRRAVRGRLGAARPPAPSADRHASGGDDADGCPHRPPDAHRDPRARVLAAAARPVAAPPRRLPDHLGLRDAVLRHRLGLRGDRRRERLERGAVPDLVPDRGGLDGRLAGARDRGAAGPDPLRLQLRALPVPRRPLHVPRPEQARVRRRGHPPAALPHRRRDPRAGGRRRDLLPERPLADARRGRGRRGDRPLDRPDGGRGPARPGLRARSGDRRPGRHAAPAAAPPADALHEHHRRLRPDPRRGLLGLRVHAEAARPGLLAGPEPARRRVPVQPADRPGGHHGQPRRVAAGRDAGAGDRPDPQPRAGDDPHRRSGRWSPRRATS